MPMNIPFNGIKIPISLASDGTNFTDYAVNMPIAPGPNLVPCLVGFDLKHPDLIADAKYSAWHLSTRKDTALEELSNQNVIDAGKRIVDVAANGEKTDDLYERIRYPAPIPISLTQIYFGCQQNTTSAHTYEGALWFVWREIYGLTQKQNQVNQAQF